MMLTNPNTVGLFEEEICLICELVVLHTVMMAR
jgi:glycine cleavage system protein P-like pyridoxal-binding family